MVTRSPKNPGLSLPAALTKARSVYFAEHQNPMDAEVLAEHMGYSSLSGAALRSIGALRQYGLLDGRGDKTRISDDAITIFADEEIGSNERAKALIAAVNNPTLFQEVKAAFAIVPSQANLRSFLEKRKFTRKSADKAAAIYRESMEFVDQETSDYNSNISELPEAKVAVHGFSEYPERAVGQFGGEMQGLSEIEYIRVSKQTGIRILADGPYRAVDIKAVVERLSAGLKQGLYDDLTLDDLDDDIS